MEKVIRDAGGCTKFVATISYSNKNTQIPSHYKYEYILNGNKIVDSFNNVNPDKVNKSLTNKKSKKGKTKFTKGNKDISKIDKNSDGKVTIAEAKAAGYKMPLTKDCWLYKYMDDRDGDGLVGE